VGQETLIRVWGGIVGIVVLGPLAGLYLVWLLGRRDRGEGD
jgi:hypothetical protein